MINEIIYIMIRILRKIKPIYIIPIFIVLTLGIYLFNKPEPKVMIKGVVFPVEVAVNGEEKNKGLGYRDKLEDGRGMIFVFDHKDYYPFWMKGMKFPLDLVWISGNLIVEITKDAPVPVNPEDTVNLQIYHPNTPVDRVLELNAGTAEKYGMAAGDEIIYKL